LEPETVELTGGIAHPGEELVLAAMRELAEETGFWAPDRLTFLVVLDSDTGRLGNRLWAFFSQNVVSIENWHPERDLTPLRVPRSAFVGSLESGEFIPVMHVGVVGIAHTKGLI